MKCNASRKLDKHLPSLQDIEKHMSKQHQNPEERRHKDPCCFSTLFPQIYFLRIKGSYLVLRIASNHNLPPTCIQFPHPIPASNSLIQYPHPIPGSTSLIQFPYPIALWTSLKQFPYRIPLSNSFIQSPQIIPSSNFLILFRYPMPSPNSLIQFPLPLPSSNDSIQFPHPIPSSNSLVQFPEPIESQQARDQSQGCSTFPGPIPCPFHINTPSHQTWPLHRRLNHFTWDLPFT